MEPLRSVSSSSSSAIASYGPPADSASSPPASTGGGAPLACVDEYQPLERIVAPRVFLCSRAVEISPLPKSAAVALADAGAAHQWIKVDSREVGMGRGDGALPGAKFDWPGMPTALVDHKGQADAPGASCEPILDVDPDCVDRELKVGLKTGRWLPPLNDCHTVAATILENCGRDVTDPSAR
jgi:hypothetical protein